MNLPSGTVTFLFTDIEGSTRLWEEHPDAMRTALARHDGLMYQSITDQGGVVFKTIGDAFCAAFASAPLALMAALTAQQALQSQPWPDQVPLRVRLALHTGTADERNGDYYGPPLNRVARLLSAGYGGQTLISQSTYELIRDTLPTQCSLLDLGAHSLRDLTRPEQVYQLCHPDLRPEFPPLKSLDTLPNNLPLQLTSFVGRERELALVKDLLAKTRLLTLTGSGGCGKTRLLLQTAADVLDIFPDGVWLVELASLTDPDLVPQTIASVLGITEKPGQTIRQVLTDHLRSKILLLVLDNCEHLLHSCAQLSETLLRACPTVKIMASSREGLGIVGEQIYRVPSLSLPDPKTAQTPEILSQSEAASLFIERATLVQSDFVVTRTSAPALASICHRLDGIPLAIELAAARVRSLSVEEIDARLDNRFRLLTGGSKTALPRQQTLRALIDWSYGLLTEVEKVLLRRLSVFVGGWTLAAAEAVCAGNDMEDWEILDLLTGLVDKSLVLADQSAGQTRYLFLETVRQYARDRLTEGDESVVVRGRHRDCFVQIALEARPKLVGAEQGQWLSTLETEHDNLRQAMTFCLEQGAETDGAEKGLRLGAALLRFWQIRGHAREGWERLMALLSHSAAQAHTKARAEALNSAGILIEMQSDYGAARSLYEESLEIWRELGDQNGIADFHMNMGNVANGQGDYPLALSHLEQSLTIKKAIGDLQGVAGSLSNLGNVACLQGDYASARSRYEESIAIQTELGNRMGTGTTFQNLGRVAELQGDLDAARSLYDKSLQIRREFGDRNGIAGGLNSLGNVALSQGDYGAAQSFYGEGAAIYRELGEWNGIAIILGNLGALAYHQGDYSGSHSHFAESLAIYRALEKKGDISSTLNNLGSVALDLGDYGTARSLYEESLALAQELGSTHGTADCLNNLGMVAYYQGDLDASRSLFTDSLTIKRELGDGPGIANSLISLGNVVFDQGDYALARSLHQESLALSRKMKDRKKIAYSLEGFAALAVPEESGERAARLFGAAVALREAIGSPLPPVERAWCDRQIEAARALLSDEVFETAWATGRAMSWEQAIQYALGE